MSSRWATIKRIVALIGGVLGLAAGLLVAAFRLAVALGRASLGEAARMTELLRSLGLPVDLDDYFSDATLAFLGSDKKRRSDTVNFVVPSAPGKVEIVPLPLSDLPGLLKKC